MPDDVEADDQRLAAGRAKARSVCMTFHRFAPLPPGEEGEPGEVVFLQFLIGPQYVRLFVGPRSYRRWNHDELSWRVDGRLLTGGSL